LASVTDVQLRAGLSVPTVMTPRLGVARQQADLALAAADVAGRCVSLTSHRSAAVLRQACVAIDSLPDLGTDPLRSLFDYDARAKTGLASTLLAWLDAHGDVALAAARLGMHHNTVRYRVARARVVLAANLDDPAVRLEVHLRLRSIRDSSAAEAGG
jgi:DNA-binding PucR family transcriptional regulator